MKMSTQAKAILLTVKTKKVVYLNSYWKTKPKYYIV